MSKIYIGKQVTSYQLIMPTQAGVRYSLLSLNCETLQVLKKKTFKIKCLLHYIVKSEVTNTYCFEI